MPSGIFVLFVIALAVFIVIKLTGSYRRAQDAAWQKAADQLGLRFQPRRAGTLQFWRSAPEQHRILTGTIAGRPVRVNTFWQGSGNNKTTYTGYWVAMPPLGLGLTVYREGLMGRIVGRLTGRDVEVGDSDFDKAHRIEGDHPEQVAAFLTPSRRVTIDRLLTELAGCRIGDDSIVYRRKGVASSAETLVGTVRRIVAAAQAIAGGSPAVDEALARQRRGDLGESAERLRAASRRSADVETRRTEAETLYAAGRYAESAEAFEDLERELPLDDQVNRWRERAAARRDAEPVVPPAADRSPDTDPGAVADALFDAKLLSFETTRIFEERYEGMPVRWEGILVRASGYRSDLDFRDGPGVKALIRVHTLANDLYAGRDVEAVVQLPPAAAADLEQRRGQRVRFSGTLVRIDPLMRNLFVANGRLA